MRIHPTTPGEYDDVIDLSLRCCPQYTRPLVEGPVRDPSLSEDRTMLTASADGRAVGFAIQLHLVGTPAGQYVTVVVVDPDHRGQGLGARLHAALADQLPAQVTAAMAQVDDADEQALAVAQHWGYQVMQRSITSQLDLVDLPAVELPEGVTVQPSPRLSFDDEAAVEAMYDASQTNPEREHAGVSTLATLRAYASAEGAERPVAVVVRDHGRPVALSYGIVHGDVAQVVYTGVDPAHRGRALGALAKACLHAQAAAVGATVAITNNEEHNVGIRHVNDTLGYRRTSGVYWLRKDFPVSS
ncbi:GNAT family N-acetyltransferase [Angustibacter luteus]|uniref:GNAT family N-acetyltransferase n=1 Tax=Angustibacter luteus TaxID=658456 RepID=A0ABW1JDX1_9ACTN